MREPNFPFAMYRDWGPDPVELPEIDLDNTMNLANWQSKDYRRPIFDEITGHYKFFPSPNGFSSYVGRAIKRRPVKLVSGENYQDYKDRVARQPQHIADRSELATALFWTSAILRQTVLEEALRNVNDGKAMKPEIAIYAADAIADYGFCLENPMDIDYTGFDHGPNIKRQIQRVGPNVGKLLLDFGNYTRDRHEDLLLEEGIVAMEVTLDEQERRARHWAPRHSAILEAYPETEISEDVLLLHVPLDEMLSIQHVLFNKTSNPDV
jgi:hypothetical protein